MAVPWTLLATLSGPMALAQPPSQATLPPVKRAAAQWLKDVTGPGKAYRTTLLAKDGSPLAARAINDRLFLLQGGDHSIGIGFRKPPRPDSSLTELRSTFQHLALDRIPVPGLKEPGWETRLRTPRSSFSEGVRLESWRHGVLTIRVQTTFFAVDGRRTDIEVPADAPMPPGTFFHVRTAIDADLLIVGRLFPPDTDH